MDDDGKLFIIILVIVLSLVACIGAIQSSMINPEPTSPLAMSLKGWKKVSPQDFQTEIDDFTIDIVVVDVVMENKSNSVVHVYPNLFVIKDGNDRFYGWDLVISGEVNGGIAGLGGEIGPDEKIRGDIAFLVPKGATDLKIIYQSQNTMDLVQELP